MQKTIEEWLKELSGAAYRKALKYAKKEMLQLEVSSLKIAVGSIFEWETTSEGFEYWDNLSTLISVLEKAKKAVEEYDMKTVEYCLQQLPAEYREKAINNARIAGTLSTLVDVDDPAAALFDAFPWRETVEGAMYWREYLIKYKNKTA